MDTCNGIAVRAGWGSLQVWTDQEYGDLFASLFSECSIVQHLVLFSNHWIFEKQVNYHYNYCYLID